METNNFQQCETLCAPNNYCLALLSVKKLVEPAVTIGLEQATLRLLSFPQTDTHGCFIHSYQSLVSGHKSPLLQTSCTNQNPLLVIVVHCSFFPCTLCGGHLFVFVCLISIVL